MARKKSDMVNEVLAHFDFEKVHRTMRFLHWTWAGSDGVPTAAELKEAAEYHMYGAIEQAISPDNKSHTDCAWISASGGFKAMAWRTKKNKLAKVQLEFIVTDWDADNED